MLSYSIKYKDLRSEKHTYKLAIGSKRIEKSLYSIPTDYKSAGTIALLLNTRRHGHARVVERSEKFDSIKYQDL